MRVPDKDRSMTGNRKYKVKGRPYHSEPNHQGTPAREL